MPPGAVLVVRDPVHQLWNEAADADAGRIGQVLADDAAGVGQALRELRRGRVEEDARRLARAGRQHDDAGADAIVARGARVHVGDAVGQPGRVHRDLARHRAGDDREPAGRNRRRQEHGRRGEVRVRPAAAAALAAVVARGAPVVRLGQDRQPRRDDRDVQLLGRLLDQQLVAARPGRRQKNAVRLVRQVLLRAEDADQPIDLVVVRLQIVVGDRPVVAQAVERAAPEIVRPEPQRDASPVVRAAADHPRPEPLPGVAGRVRVGLPLERPASERGVELAEVALRESPRRGAACRRARRT